MTNTIQEDEMTNNRLNRLIMLHLLTILTLALSACGPDSREICQSHDDCLPCEQCKNGTCVLDESRLNACGECDQPDPEEICGDGLDNDCDGETDESCEGSCVGVVCDSPPGPCLASPGACRDGVCGYPPLDDGTACDDQDGCTTDDACTSGVCFGSPVTCDAPPQNECLDENTLRSYSANGTCENGACTYAYNDIACIEGCQDGLCKEDPCYLVVCDTPPNECYQPEGFCSKSVCHYGYRDGVSCDDEDGCTQDDICQSGVCGGTPIACNSPPSNECLDADTMRSYATAGVCIDGVCSYGYQDVTCTHGCEAGLCRVNPCDGVVCDDPPNQCYRDQGTCNQGVCHYGLLDGSACDDSNACTRNDTCQGGNCTGTPVICDTPPPDVCRDGSTLRVYSSAGSCEAGACTYSYQDVACTHGCLNGFCNEDPCAGVVCDDPPSQCHRSPGTCVSGSCQYGYLNGASCDDSDACTQDDTCSSGVCAGTPMSCDSPPPDECADASTLKIYATSGSCAGGVCTYTYQLIPCDDPPDACHQAAGRCAGGSCQYDPVTACIDSDGCCPPGCAGQDDDCPAQSSWDRAYGGSDRDLAKSIQQTSDGGYILAGCTNSFGAGDWDAWVLKLDASGNAAWQKTYGGSDCDSAYSIQQTSDGGYIVAGATASFGAGSRDAWVLKLDASGNAAWQKTYGGSDWDSAYSIQQTSDGGYILAGYTGSFGAGNGDTWVLKLDASGNVAWQKTYGDSEIDRAKSIQQTSEGGYILAGETESFGAVYSDAWVLKLDASGNVAWQKTYGGSDYDWANSIQQTSDGGYILAGETESFGAGEIDMWVLKLDASGNAAWHKTYGGSDFDSANSIQQTSDGGYILAGDTYSFGAGAGKNDMWVLKLDVGGNAAWQKTYGGSDYDVASSIQQTSEGGYILAGDTNSFGAGDDDAWVLKLEADGVISGSCPDGIGADTYVVATSTSVSTENSTATAETSNATVGDTNVVPQDSSATQESLCGD